MAVTVRDERPDDHRAIRDVVTAAFGRPAEADLVEWLRHDGDCVFSLVAVEDDEPIGHLLLSRMRAPFRALGMAPVSVMPDRQRCGIGSRLIEASLARAARAGWDCVFVFGAPAFYRRFGCDPDLARGFVSPYAGPHLMAKPLRGALPVTTGAIEYAPAFARLP